MIDKYKNLLITYSMEVINALPTANKYMGQMLETK